MKKYMTGVKYNAHAKFLKPAVCNIKSSVQNAAGNSNHNAGMVPMSDS